MPHIPIDPRRGHVTAHGTTIAVTVYRDGAALVIAQYKGAPHLGEFLEDVSARLSKEDVEALCKGKEVRL